MSVPVWVWASAGFGAGVAHATALWRSAHRWRHPPLAAMWRIPIVVGLLAGAAIAGRLLAAVGGWASGLGGTGVALVIWSRR